ncbi:Hypothetical protein OINT_4000076 [Brucella intermedia LMG 3301]|uniref:Uncharacterized protein n=1 Tax=Brucella intermedia LMG 3301 TaxID=641118 RepID=C4WR72_9HYPH|nr:Hypothetical protein OINT_4000076 [Brucella intermedia LMG 3301]
MSIPLCASEKLCGARAAVGKQLFSGQSKMHKKEKRLRGEM